MRLSFVTLSALVLLSSTAYLGEAADRSPVLASQRGLASFYGTRLQGEETASGEILDSRELIAAHPTFPFGTIVRVTNLENGRAVRVRIVDRGPARKYQADGVIIDLSVRAARVLGFLHDGRTSVRVDVLEWGNSG